MNVSPGIRWIALVLIALLIAPLAVSAAPQGGPTARIDPRAVQAAAQGQGAFWVVLRAKADLSPAYSMYDWNARGRFVVERLQAAANASQAGIRALLQARGKPHQPFWIVNAIKVTADRATLDELARRPEVAEIAADQVYAIPAPLPGTAGAMITAVEWGVNNIRAPLVWSSYNVRGSGIVVANIDTGAQWTHPALKLHYRGWNGATADHNYNWYDPARICGNPSLAPCDNNGHGTHTMGTMVGDDGAGNQIGVAPQARWIAAKGCESTSCTTTSLLSAGQWVLAPCRLDGTQCTSTKRPNIVNNSWGNINGADTFYQSTVQSWVASGIFPVFANGNTINAPCNSVSSPASYSESYGVGAYDSTNMIASFSNRGAAPSTVGGQIKPNISAPGVNIRSSWNNGGYNTISGTSMAAPHVAGAVALLWSANPSLIGNITQTRTYLDQTSIDASNLTCGGTSGNNNVYGQGRLDAYAAVSAAVVGMNGTLSGTVTNASTGAAIASATVSATAGATTYSATTNSSGVYNLSLPAGTYSVTASASGFTSNTVTGVVVSSNATTTRNVALSPLPTTGTLTGTVTNASTGAAIAGATVSATTGATTYSATTNSSGGYSLTVPAGTYSVTASATGCTGQTMSATVSGGATTTLSFALSCGTSGAGILIGDVVDGWTGQPLVGAGIRANGPAYGMATTDANGHYSMMLPGGSYTVMASKTGYYSHTEYGVVVHNGTTTELSFFLDDTSSNPCPTC